MTTRDYNGRLMALPSATEVDVKIYLMADAGFDIKLYAGTLERRFPLLNVVTASPDKVLEYLADKVMDRNITIRVHKGYSKTQEYAVELIDSMTGVNHNRMLQTL